MKIPPAKQSSAIADLADLADPDAKEAICPLCGGFGYVNRNGYCGTEECSLATLERARREHPETVMRYPGLTVLNTSKLHKYGDPDYSHLMPPEDDSSCATPGCTEFARPNDSLCIPCRRKNPKQPKPGEGRLAWIDHAGPVKKRPFDALRKLPKK